MTIELIIRSAWPSMRFPTPIGAKPWCVPKTSSRIDLMSESLNVNDDGLAAMLLADADGLAVQVEQPT